MKQQARTRGTWRIFRWPLLIGISSMFGLISALVGDGIYDLISWLCLGALIVIAAVSWQRSE